MSTFSTLYCLTLFCFVAIFVTKMRDRSRNTIQHDRQLSSILKKRLAEGAIDEMEYQRLIEILTKK
ncbi:hypothetical protein CHH83_22380 [Bacillus sp. 7586-K]|nr:hypothetical protein CHH83_22380 [Bacillus sp. 7586-K]